ncbi:P-loop containing nucleoside triphosphate hydrolase protein [Trichodelitschia bisporula]|uniref:P-loop containing nucleoside triphosphate hydrolase protein n=1 Tax=Trichodelitschia bisporula TaxID=703511 RepID=A0A6G1I326_9PEZI|nr:P-loop containing nucleoside triphosphate hydrolase protein [Trichodelitschia bisporula]
MEPFVCENPVLQWYQTIRTRRVDLVGDFAGSELCLIELDSLLLHCFSNTSLDFSDGCQILHAAYIVEKLLRDLVSRKCNFNIVCFEQNEGLCVPPMAHRRDRPKYILARWIIYRHLQRTLSSSGSGISLHTFGAFTDAVFAQYLQDTDTYFVMCHDGAVSSSAQCDANPGKPEDYRSKPPPSVWNSAGRAIPRDFHDTKWPFVEEEVENPVNTVDKTSSLPPPPKDESEERPRRARPPPSDVEGKIAFRAMISWFIAKQYNVALINELTFVDTKAWSVVLEFERVEASTRFSAFYTTKPTEHVAPLHTLPAAEKLSVREQVTVYALNNALSRGSMKHGEARLMLLHTSAISFLPLRSRRFPMPKYPIWICSLLSRFSTEVTSLLRSDGFHYWLDFEKGPFNLVDFVDGRLMAFIMDNDEFCSALLAHDAVKAKFEALGEMLSGVVRQNIARITPPKTAARADTAVDTDTSPKSDEYAILPFKNPVFNKHLAPVILRVDDEQIPHITLDQAKIFLELTHWHNHKKALAVKGPPKVDDKWARRRNQRFLAEMQAYAASLMNASGKMMEPETVVAVSSTESDSSSSGPAVQPTKTRKPTGKENKKGQPSKNSKKPGPTKKGGKAAALEAAAAVKAGKDQARADINASFWKETCKHIMLQKDPQLRYVAARAHLRSIPAGDLLIPEIELFAIDCLLRIWATERKLNDADSGLGIPALIWDAFLRLSKVRAGMTTTVVAALEKISKELGFSAIKFESSSPDRPLAFLCYGTSVPGSLSIPGSPVDFQLEHCGPYFDRNIDSAPDDRVPFNPDAWQRKVLDAIDRDESLLVVAPTSAGKTFISFYAMKKVLKGSDDGIVVYVAPTKALVNQIAAEIQAQFSKKYKHAGRSVWGIHTRDFRVNDPSTCQILVTVPHILQIMLLSPVHAQKASSWSCRVKRIIFDEVHCIGQAEDGLIWQQLLLQAPCPIIALSATVGNPKEFGDWLSSTQEANGMKLTTVQHHSRYSDLRKFIYVPPKTFCFSGLPDAPRIHTPGLDDREGFSLVHPVASLANKSRTMPNDLSLEGRDCLRLWNCMAKHQTEKYPLPSNLHPKRALPSVIKKVDVLKWEAGLKAVLAQWIADHASPFETVRNELGKELDCPARRDVLATKHNCNAKCEAREVHAESLKSTILPALADLHAKGALPCIVFNWDRTHCEQLARTIIDELKMKEELWKETSPIWKKEMADYAEYLREQEAATARVKKAKAPKKVKGRDEEGEKPSAKEDKREGVGLRESKWACFNPKAPLNGFHFVDVKKLAPSELAQYQAELRGRKVSKWLIEALERGIGIHHSGMNRKYRIIVEVLFRKGFLRVIIATGTLALGINMPCKTVMFAGDSVFLTALNFRQCAGRAGRRSFDVLGNVVFLCVPTVKVFRLIGSRLPDLSGHFPITTSMVLRLAVLLHGSGNSPYANQTINAILSQPCLYLGSGDSRAAVLHHLRFSIEYLRRQYLLDARGVPINFAGCVSHLYYTEGSAWVFHALLSSGYLHKLCADIDTKPQSTCRTLMLVMAHLFGQRPARQADSEFIDKVVHRSSSVVFLPPLPVPAQDVIAAHNADTLAVFVAYVRTFAEQHLKSPDVALPLTGVAVGGSGGPATPGTLPAPTVRSAFVALSGHGDEFGSIAELCSTVRGGVFLEEAVVPYLPVEKSEPLNAYLYDFYKHGSVKELEVANGIRRSDVWYALADFSLVLATIVTSIANILDETARPDEGMEDVVGVEDERVTQEENEVLAKSTPETSGSSSDDEGESDDAAAVMESSTGEGTRSSQNRTTPAETIHIDLQGLPKVLQAFTQLKASFDEKFTRMWA